MGCCLFAQPTPSNYFEQHYLFQERLAKGLVFDIIQDKKGFLWFGTEYGLVQYDGITQKTFLHEPANPYSLAGNVITCLAEDAKGNLWVGTMNSGLHYFDRITGRFLRFQYNAEDEHSLANNKINKILVTKNGAVWVTTQGGGIHLYREGSGKFKRFQKPAIRSLSTDALLEGKGEQLWLGDFFGLSQWMPEDSLFLPRAEIQSLKADGAALKALAQEENGRIWAGFRNGGLMFMNPGDSLFLPVSAISEWPGDKTHRNIWEIFIDQNQQLWVGTDDGLIHLERKGIGQPFSLSHYSLTQERRYLSICQSKDGVMWVGTNDGVVVLKPRHKLFRHFTPLKEGEPPDTKCGVTTISHGKGNQIWVGTVRGLFQFDIVRQQFHQNFTEQHPLLDQFEDSNISALFQSKKDQLWIATIEGFNQGFSLYCYKISEKLLQNFSSRHLFFYSYGTFGIAEDQLGSLWFGNGNGLLQYTEEIDSVQLIHNPKASIGRNKVNQLLVSDRNKLWIGTNEAGLAAHELSGLNAISNHISFIESGISINKRIISILEDRQGLLWLGTAGGLALFDPSRESFKSYDARNGLKDNVIKNIAQDSNERIWITSQTHIARFDAEKEVFINYDKSDGLEIDEFWDRTSYSDPSGRLYFGGDDGLVTFHPGDIQDNDYTPPVVFTMFLLFNKEIHADPNTKLLPKPVHYNPTIKLKHNQNVFTIHFAALSYINSQKNQYAIQMEGFEQDWQLIGHKTEATYTNLDPGTYFFRVKATNNDGIWNEEPASLKLLVLPPWYQSWWAYLLYLIILISGIYFFYHFQLNRRLAEVEAQRLRELDNVKTQLYTNITHEFRTPLTLIQGPVERAIDEPSFVLGKRELKRIRQNCQRLLNLIRQMLSLNKLEAGALHPDYRYGDVMPALRYIVDSFSSFAKSQGVELELKTNGLPQMMDYDQEKLFDILSNLLSNAIKFTPSGGKVQVLAAKHQKKHFEILEIAVSDTGSGIPREELNRIFDQFYQVAQPTLELREESVRSGSGIGLALSKKLAELMEGTIEVSSEMGKGSTFYLQLAIRHTKKGIVDVRPFGEVYIPNGGHKNEKPDAKVALEISKGASILIVEDNEDVAQFIGQCLPKSFHKMFASNGEEGLDLAVEYIPDLIISDVLMPKTDGYSLTEKIKQDQRTSHIPIILLTAKADLDSRIEGLEKGADAYMAKPFSRQELLIRIENLLESRRRLQAYYLQQSGIKELYSEKEMASQKEHEFLRTARQLIEDRIQQESYPIEALAQDLHMSPSQLYRKMMALTGQSPSKFFRHIQVAQAKKLLTESDLNISDIAYQTGFNEPAYFTRVFTAETGVSPTAYRRK